MNADELAVSCARMNDLSSIHLCAKGSGTRIAKPAPSSRDKLTMRSIVLNTTSTVPLLIDIRPYQTMRYLDSHLACRRS